MVKGLLGQLGSPRLAVSLLIILALLASWGTTPVAGTRSATPTGGLDAVSRFFGLTGTFHSPLFTGLLLLLVANVAVCTVKRLWASGFRPAQRRLPDLLVHLSIILALTGGAAKGFWGTAGTAYLLLNTPTETIYDSSLDRDRPLGFALVLESREFAYYPLRARVGISLAGTGEKIELIEAAEGLPAVGAISGLQLEASTAGDDAVRLRVSGTEGPGEVVLQAAPGREATAAAGKYLLTLVSFRREVKTVRGNVAVFADGKMVARGRIEPNRTMRHGGTGICLTGWGRDDEGRDYVAIQAASDPFAPLFWAGCILGALALPIFIFTVRRRPSQA